MHTIVLATGNAHKAEEIGQIINDPSILIKTARKLNLIDHLREEGNTFHDNALQKARAIYAASGLPALADDSGLEVFFLNHRPGIYSARYAGPDATDEANIRKLLRELGPLSMRRRTARFRCVAAFVADGIEETITGDVHGYILEKPRGSGGFGYDPIFLPRGFNKTFAEMPPDEKHAISHRGKAFRRIKPIVLNYFKMQKDTAQV